MTAPIAMGTTVKQRLMIQAVIPKAVPKALASTIIGSVDDGTGIDWAIDYITRGTMNI
jgi:hypothetical protein